ncbi:MAG: hypothetical protein B6D39_05880 [Anaerolineae bacterium UTCFX2]|jgi:ribosomal protein S18 acetylase RimI-like enzyme|nr:GNAT family N-acetyltransferase [Anaerolineae bacterium]MCZ7552949.1 GNAT family N-acetyltransferase [Anaerolineales bacterium]OQY91768.1 MAG: hypothetical protein B6D39_05880 [Anaerolineae bacterium UTCFX2]
MIITNRIRTRRAEPEDFPKLADLIHFEAFVHRHLDYRVPLDWIGQEQFLLLEEGSRIEAALACPPDPLNVAWVRLFAVSARLAPEHAWNTLWEAILPSIRSDKQIQHVAAIPLFTWFEALLKKHGFSRIQEIVLLNRELSKLPSEAPDPRISIRPMTLDDLKAVHAIDEEAFSPIWVNSPAYIEIAFRQALIASVAEDNGEVVGYQISTGAQNGGHLARLAVRPRLQGKGIGYALLFDLIRQFNRRGAHLLTVNTQKDNQVSLALYRHAGFELTSEEYPIYELDPSYLR